VTSNTCWDWYLSKAYMIIAAQSIVARFLATFEEFPPAAEGGELHDRPGAREDAGCDERGAGLMSLKSWNDTRTTQAIVRIRRERSTKRRARGAGRGLRQRRHALAEKPMPIELGFILQRLTDMAEKDESLREQQPWKAAYEEDYAWLGGVIDKHYAGDDSDVKVLMGGILQAFAGQTVEEYMSAAATFLDAAAHPTLGRRLRDCGYVPMVELLRYLEGHGVTCFIASGRQPRLHARGSRDSVGSGQRGAPPAASLAQGCQANGRGAERRESWRCRPFSWEAAALPLLAALGRVTGLLESPVWATVLGVAGMLIALAASWVILRCAALASRRIRLATTAPMQTYWTTIGWCGKPPKDSTRTFVIVSITLTIGAWILVPILVAIALAT
jgi:hypothetical protein